MSEMDIREDPIQTVRRLCADLTSIEGSMERIAADRGKDSTLYEEYKAAHERKLELLRRYVRKD